MCQETRQFIIIIIETVFLSNFKCRPLPSFDLQGDLLPAHLVATSVSSDVVHLQLRQSAVPSDVHSESPNTRLVHSLSSILAMCPAYAYLLYATTAMTSLTLVIFLTQVLFLVSQDSSKHFSLHAPPRNSRPLGGLLCKGHGFHTVHKHEHQLHDLKLGNCLVL